MGGEGHEFHAMDFLIYAYLQSGREAEASKVIEEVKAMPAMSMAGMDRDMQAFAMSKFPAMYALELHRWPEAAALPVIAKADAGDRAYTYWAKTIGSARSGDLAGAKKSLAEIDAIRKDFLAHKKAYVAEWTGMLYEEGSAWIQYGEGKGEEATATLRKVADHEDAVGEEQTSMPAREMLADMLLEMKRPEQALAEYRGDLKFNPKRFNGLYGAGQAAEMAGQASQAAEYYAVLVKTCEGSSSVRPELAKAKQAVVLRNRICLAGGSGQSQILWRLEDGGIPRVAGGTPFGKLRAGPGDSRQDAGATTTAHTHFSILCRRNNRVPQPSLARICTGV
jgi:tetratricopeptide (TPR) repeat protein